MVIVKSILFPLREECPNIELFLVHIFPYSDWIRRFTEYLSIFRPNRGKYGPEKTPYFDTFHTVFMLEKFKAILEINLFFTIVSWKQFFLFHVQCCLHSYFVCSNKLTSYSMKITFQLAIAKLLCEYCGIHLLLLKLPENIKKPLVSIAQKIG